MNQQRKNGFFEMVVQYNLWRNWTNTQSHGPLAARGPPPSLSPLEKCVSGVGVNDIKYYSHDNRHNTTYRISSIIFVFCIFFFFLSFSNRTRSRWYYVERTRTRERWLIFIGFTWSSYLNIIVSPPEHPRPRHRSITPRDE